jgi:hypothetical protein
MRRRKKCTVAPRDKIGKVQGTVTGERQAAQQIKVKVGRSSKMAQAQASVWIQEEIDCLEERKEELEKEIQKIEERMRAEEAAAPDTVVLGGRVFASRRGFAYQLGKGRIEEERRKCATEEARRAAAGCREHIGAGKKRQRSIEIAAKLRELDAKVGKCLKNAAENQRLAMEFRKEMEGLMEEQEQAVREFGVDWARLLEEIREVTAEQSIGEGQEGTAKGDNVIEWRVGSVENFADEEEDRAA